MPETKLHKFEIHVSRTYHATTRHVIEAEDINRASELAIEESDNTDCTGQKQLGDVSIESTQLLMEDGTKVSV